MADLPVPGSIQAQPNVKVHKLWTEQQIAEIECRIKRLEIDAEELIKGRLKNIEAEIEMLKRKLVLLYQKNDQLEKFGLEEVIDVNGTNIKRLENQGG